MHLLKNFTHRTIYLSQFLQVSLLHLPQWLLDNHHVITAVLGSSAPKCNYEQVRAPYFSHYHCAGPQQCMAIKCWNKLGNNRHYHLPLFEKHR